MIYSTRKRQFAAALGAVVAVVVAAGAALAASAFNDVTDNHPASAEITAAHQVGVFQGYGDGTFRPDGKLTRGQAELVIHRMLTWQGTDDDGNFEISRADAAVLAMSGLCGLDPDRIPACAAVAAASEAEVQAAYNRGYDDGLDAATPTGSTPPPVTNPPAPTTAAQKCEDQNGFRWTNDRNRPYWSSSNHYLGWRAGLKNYLRDGSRRTEITPGGGGYYRWHHRHVAVFPNGLVCTEYQMTVHHNLENPDDNSVRTEVFSFCWETGIDPISGREYVGSTRYQYHQSDDRKSAADATPAILAAIAGDRPSLDYWPAHDHADCLSRADPGPDPREGL